jgi:hypothetical protein
MSASASTTRAREEAVATLAWFEPGMPAYHIETTCGRYTVSRVTVSARGVVHYVAWRTTRDANKRIVKRVELDSATIPLEHTAEQRIEARRKMQQRCAEDVLELNRSSEGESR